MGGGLGGLGAACELALQGQENVMLLEKHNTPGGFATSFVRGRFEFEGALHELSSFGTEENPGSLRPFFKELGVLEKVQFVQVPEIYRSVFTDGYDVTLPFGYDAYFDKMGELFPAERQKLAEFKDVCTKVNDGMNFLGSQGGKISPVKIVLKHPWLARVTGLTLKELYDKFKFSEKLIAVLTQLWGYLGLAPSRLNALLFVGMMLSYLHKGAAFPQGRSHAMTSAMLEAFQKRGGQYRLNALVDKIHVDGRGLAKAVELLNGDIYECRALISNVNPICVTMKMLPPQVVSSTMKKKLYAPRLGPSAFSVYLGLNAPPEQLGFTGHECFIQNTYDIEEAVLPMEDISLKPRGIVAACYNAVDPSSCPEGTTQIVLTQLQYGRPWHGLPADQYFQKKDQIANDMITLVEQTISPTIRDYIEVAVAATPLTYYRYAKTLDGTIYGFEHDVLGSPVFRLKTNESPLKNLYWGSSWANTSGGFGPSMDSGRIAARACRQYLKSTKGGR